MNTMGETTKKLLIFAAGLGIGAVVSWKYFEDKYKKIADEEITSVKEMYKKHSEANDDISEEESVEEKPTNSRSPLGTRKEGYAEYENLVANYYTVSSEVTNDISKEVENRMNEPYIIKPEEFGTIEYDTVSLTYYADKVLVDEDNNLIQDIDYLVGEDNLNHFGEYEEDSVFVRNDYLKTDFEILLDEDNYYCEDDDE